MVREVNILGRSGWFTGIAIAISLWVIVFAAAFAIVMEFGGVSRALTELWFPYRGALPLHQTDYYGKSLEKSPYEAFTIQHLNPFYLFSLPWRETDIKAANNEYVHVNGEGFRINPNLAMAGKEQAVLLGGSAAFGHHSSSDAHTIAARLTEKTRIGFINRNSPSWNSHQELVALARYVKPYILSISFSFSNDVSIYCDGKEPALLGAPESFNYLEVYFNDIRGKPLVGFFSGASLDPEKLFPETWMLGRQIKDALNGQPEKKRKGKRRGARCNGKDVTPVVDAFLHNQIAMAQLSKARGAVHMVVVQPSYPLHSTSTPDFWTRSDAEYDFRRRAIAQLKASPFCSQHCYDFSVLFDRFGGASHAKENNGVRYLPRIFADDVHLTDAGVDIVAEEISKIVKSRVGN